MPIYFEQEPWQMGYHLSRYYNRSPIKSFAVTGARDYTDKSAVEKTLAYLPEDALMINGGARGADLLAANYWTEQGRPIKIIRADWQKHGKKAGPIRNREMIREKPNIVIAFPGGKGTRDMMDASDKAGIYVLQLRPE